MTNNSTKLEQWSIDVFRRAVEAYGGESIPGETECYAARVIQTAFEDRERKLREKGQFLLDRLAEHEIRMTSDEDSREWFGHVTPAMARFRQALKETPDAQ